MEQKSLQSGLHIVIFQEALFKGQPVWQITAPVCLKMKNRYECWQGPTWHEESFFLELSVASST